MIDLATSFINHQKGFPLNKYFKNVSETGVIKVMTDATQRGYKGHDVDGWVNLGQGMPEPQVLTQDVLDPVLDNKCSLEYSPVTGRPDLKKSILKFYDRCGDVDILESEVSITPGGRAGLSRVLAILSPGNIGTFEPDYTAYFEAIDCFSGLNHIPIGDAKLLDNDLEELSKLVKKLNINYFLLSNPCNPTGKFISLDKLCKFITMLHEMGVFVIVDEFYSHWVKSSDGRLSTILREKEYFNFEKLIVVDGVTKNWMSPGLRIGWIIGREDVIRKINSVGSFLDGGASNLSQLVCMNLIDRKKSFLEDLTLQNYYQKKRSKLIKFIEKLDIADSIIDGGSGFYLWIKVNKDKFENDLAVYEYLIRNKVISVPGRYFYIGHKNKDHVRLSFGPNLENLFNNFPD